MRFITVRDLRARGTEIWKSLRAGEEAVLTHNGTPVALLIGTKEDRLEDTVRMVRQVKAQAAVSRMRQHAHSTRLNRMSGEEIESEIRESRRTRQR